MNQKETPRNKTGQKQNIYHSYYNKLPIDLTDFLCDYIEVIGLDVELVKAVGRIKPAVYDLINREGV